MSADPLLGLIYHWTGGLAAASFYIPFKKVKGWAWETYWLVGGAFSWIVAPLVLACILVPGFVEVLRSAPRSAVGWAYFWGLMWGIGGLTFGLSMRYLGIALGYAIALGLCTAFGTLMPPLFEARMGELTGENSGRVILIGIAVCLGGIVLSGMAGVSKERELTSDQKAGTVKEFHFLKGLLVATFAGVMSASMSYGLTAGKPIAALAKVQLAQQNRSDLWQNLPVLVVILLGGFTTNFLWCVLLNIRNRTAHQYTSFDVRDVAEVSATEAITQWDAEQLSERERAAEPVVVEIPRRPIPLLANYLFSAAAGVIWYFQFFFYSMGETRMGKDYAFSSWTLHMASIIIFSTCWGIALKEWKGTSRRTHLLIALGLAVLIGSTVVVGYGNYLKSAATQRTVNLK